MIIFLTGPSGVGKSTVIESVINHFKPKCHGIVAREIKSAMGARIGFAAINQNGESHQFMTKTDKPSKFSIGMFDVNLEVINNFVSVEILRNISSDNSFIYLDEIGRAQMMSDKFITATHALLKSNKNILSTIVYDDEPKSRQFKQNPGVCIMEVNEINRNILPKILIAAFTNAALFNQLDGSQQRITYNLMNYFIAQEQYIAATKLFSNALDYTVNKKIQLQIETAELRIYQIRGQTDIHRISYNKDNHQCQCDCSLSNGQKDFINLAQTCSHEMTILITEHLYYLPKLTIKKTKDAKPVSSLSYFKCSNLNELTREVEKPFMLHSKL